MSWRGDYWEKRAKRNFRAFDRRAGKTLKAIRQGYLKAFDDLNQDIRAILGRAQRLTGLTPDEVKALLREPVSRKITDALLAKINSIDDPAVKREILKEVNLGGYRARITRLEALQDAVRIEYAKAAGTELKQSSALYNTQIEEAYYRSAHDVSGYIGQEFTVQRLSEATRNAILNNPWSGAHFSKRIWSNRRRLVQELNRILIPGIQTGRSYAQLARELSLATQSGIYAAETLVRTEASYMIHSGELESYRAMGIQQYIILAVLDRRTSKLCRSKDREIHGLDEAEPGKTLPPFHPNCRTTIAPYVGDTPGSQRRARDKDGNDILVRGDMSYREWYNTYIKPHELPKTIKAPDGELSKQLGFRGEDHRMRFIPKHAEIKNVVVIAGPEVRRPFRIAGQLSETYGGAPDAWLKKSGTIESDRYVFEVHWAEMDGKMYTPKIKGRKEKR